MSREPIPLFFAAFAAALGKSPVAGESPPRKELTDLDKDRIRKALDGVTWQKAEKKGKEPTR